MARLEIVEAGAVWEIRRAVYGLKEGPRLWQEEKDKVLSKLTWYFTYRKSHAPNAQFAASDQRTQAKGST
eukprot:12442712-Prorocentrum_lima.AAC.1